MKKLSLSKKLTALVLTLFVICTCVVILINAAAGKVIYLDPVSGSDSNGGTSTSDAFKTLKKSITSAGSTETVIVLTSDLTVSSSFTEPAHTGAVTITSKYDGYSSGAKINFTSSSETAYRLNGPTTFENITINTNASTVFAAQHNAMTFGAGISTPTGYDRITLLGGYQTPSSSVDVSLDSNITVKSGSFYEVAGFSRTKGDASHDFTGTANITVSGGKIKNLFGGTLYNHTGGSLVLTVSGGTISNIYTAGDLTRSITGDATVSLLGGSIGNVYMNNITGDARLELLGTCPSSVSVSYSTTTLEENSERAASHKVAAYNAVYCSSSMISLLKSQFDEIENATELYVAAGGSGTGGSASSPLGSFATAYGKLASMGGTLYVSGSLNCNTQLASSTLKDEIKIVGLDSTAQLVFPDGYELDLDAPTKFENITLTVDGSASIISGGSKLTLGAGIVCNGAIDIIGSAKTSAKVELTVQSGTFNRIVGTTAQSINSATVNVLGGNVAEIVCGGASTAKSLRFQMSGGTVTELVSTEGSVTDSLVFKLGGGTIGTLDIKNSTGNNILSVASTKITTGSCSNIDKSKSELIVGRGSADKNVSAFLGYFGKISYENNIYVAAGGKGTGYSPLAPIGDINRAVRLLGKAGKVVLCGDYLIDENYTIVSHTYPVTYTSKDSDTDFRSTAKLDLEANLLLSGESTIEYLHFETEHTNAFIYAREKKLTIGDGVDTILKNGYASYISLCGGRSDTSGNGDANLTINSGNWEAVRAGSTRTGTASSVTSNINVTINGGIFHKYVLCSSRGQVWGNVNVLVNGGVFYQGLYGMYEEDGGSYNATYDMVFDIRGGEFHGDIAPARSKQTKLHGTYKVYLRGGDFSGVTDLCGTSDFQGNMDSELYIDPSVDINAEEIGTQSFTNYLYNNHADPFIFYHDGFYYYTSTGSTQINLRKAATIADLKTANPKVILQPSQGKNLWSPEIHYFSAAEVGEGNEGWYMFLSYDDGESFANQRQHVVKCLDGDDLMGRWGDPVTGEVNKPRKIEFPDSPRTNVDQFCSGMSVLKANGTTYITFVTDTGTGTADHHQTINITRMTNPWTMSGANVAICKSDYDWEMGGYGYANGTWYPKVVEGASPVYGDNGEVYLMYTGSGYWTVEYKLGFMKLTGSDPMLKSSWTKNPTPVFSKNEEINGCGHGSYFKDHEGNWWVCYHAYTGPDTTSKRKSFVERLYITSSGVSIGNGSTHPAPIDTVYTIPKNPMPLSDKIYGFKTIAEIPSADRIFTSISTAQELIELMNDSSAWSGNYRLAANIDLSNYTGTLSQQPIGNATIKFTGAFDGNGKTISAINITSGGSVGLFGCISGKASITSLTVYGSVTNNFASTDAETLDSEGNYVCTGGLVGYMLGGTVEDCSVYMTVTGQGNVGGVVGMVYIPSDNNTVAIKKVVGDCTVSAKYGNIGGIVGRITVKGQADIGVTLDSCTNYSDISSTSSDRCRVGGIVAYVRTETQGVVINKCTNNGDISGTNAQTATNHVPHVGGIGGRFEIATGANASINITECKNTGNITSNYRVGGIVALVTRTNTCTAKSGIYRCENNGSVTVINRAMSKNEAGGITGRIDNNCTSVKFEIIDCANYAYVNCDGGYCYLGGIIGYNVATDIIRCVNYGVCTSDTGTVGAIVGSERAKGSYVISDCYALTGTADNISGETNASYCTHTNNTFVSADNKTNQSVYTALDFENTWTMRADGAALIAHTSTVVGDIDSDGVLTNSDIVLIIRYLSGWDIGGAEAMCDLDANGRINNRDAIELIVKLSELGIT